MAVAAHAPNKIAVVTGTRQRGSVVMVSAKVRAKVVLDRVHLVVIGLNP